MTSQYNLLTSDGDNLAGVDVVDVVDVHVVAVRPTSELELGTVTEASGDGREVFDMSLLRRCMRKKTYNFQAYKHYLLPKKLPVHQTCSELMVSKQETTHYGDILDIDSKCIRPTVEYILEFRRFLENEELLVQTKKKAEDMRQVLDDQWNNLAHDENELKISFIRFNKFVKENLDKRERAAKKIVYEQEVRYRKEKDVEKLKVDLERIRKLKVKMEKAVRSNRIFEEYLSRIITGGQSQDNFKTIDDILNRYATIIGTKRKLAEMQNQRLAELEENRLRLAKIVKHYKLIILGLMTKRFDLLHRYKKVHISARETEMFVDKIKNNANEAIKDVVVVRFAIENLYVYMCERRGIEPTIPLDDFEHQLNFIKTIFLESVKAKDIISKNMAASRTRIFTA